MTDEIEAAALVEIVRSIDPAMSVTKLRRWHRLLLLRRPRQVGLGKGAGSRSYYPADVVEPTKTIAALLKERRDFKWIGWKLWLMQYPVGECYWRPCLRDAAKLWDRMIPDIRDLLDADDDTLTAQIDELFNGKPNNELFAAIRKGLGPDRFETAMTVLLDMSAGFYAGPSDVDTESKEYRDAVDLMDLVLGMRRARTDHVEGGPTLLRNDPVLAVGDYLPLLIEIGRTLSAVSWVGFLDNLSDDDLGETRYELVNTLGYVAVLNAVFESRFGGDAFGLRRAAALRGLLSSGDFAIMIVGWAILRQQPGMKEGARAIQEAMATQGIPADWNMERVKITSPASELSTQKLKRTRRVYPHQEWLDNRNKS